MKYFIDTEFIEGTQRTLFGYSKPTIDLISIGIVAEDGREYYAISKEFNLKEAWNRYDIKQEWYSVDESTQSTRDIKVYWLRDNVLLPIYLDKVHGDMRNHIPFSYSAMKGILKGFGKSNKQIAEEIKDFIYDKSFKDNKRNPIIHDNNWLNGKPEFYGYYSDYDWVVFCWLFGKMIDLPKGFPMYCIDLKQELERLNESLGYNTDDKNKSYRIQEHKDYPKQTNEHNARSDAKWNKQLYEFLNTL